MDLNSKAIVSGGRHVPIVSTPASQSSGSSMTGSSSLESLNAQLVQGLIVSFLPTICSTVTSCVKEELKVLAKVGTLSISEECAGWMSNCFQPQQFELAISKHKYEKVKMMRW